LQTNEAKLAILGLNKKNKTSFSDYFFIKNTLRPTIKAQLLAKFTKVSYN